MDSANKQRWASQLLFLREKFQPLREKFGIPPSVTDLDLSQGYEVSPDGRAFVWWDPYEQGRWFLRCLYCDSVDYWEEGQEQEEQKGKCACGRVAETQKVLGSGMPDYLAAIALMPRGTSGCSECGGYNCHCSKCS